MAVYNHSKFDSNISFPGKEMARKLTGLISTMSVNSLHTEFTSDLDYRLIFDRGKTFSHTKFCW